MPVEEILMILNIRGQNMNKYASPPFTNLRLHIKEKFVSGRTTSVASGVATGGLGGAQAPPTQNLASVGIAQNRGAKNIYMGGVPSFGHI